MHKHSHPELLNKIIKVPKIKRKKIKWYNSDIN